VSCLHMLDIAFQLVIAGAVIFSSDCKQRSNYLRLKRSLMHTCTRTTSPPLAAPCKALPKIRTSIVLAVAHTADDTENHASSVIKMIFLPHMSESVTQIALVVTLARRNDAPIHVYPTAEDSSSLMVGAAVATMVTSRAAANKES
jgi:hypothetical protein